MSNQNEIRLICLILILAGFVACAKEYSFEGDTPPNVPSPSNIPIDTDSAKPAGLIIPTCDGCEITDTSAMLKWSFKSGNSSLCGFITKAVASPDRTAMTFFGPSACSVDTGLIITAYFNREVLNQNQNSLTAGFTALQYYDNTTGFDVLKSTRPHTLSLTMNSYNHLTGLATGTFAGWVVDKNGTPVKIEAGKFKIKF